ncbi:MAG TPA: hypothetical protein VFF06_16485 [Polyangia bacterium]|nr:hypothetical protein [Polyangia bacterium]
MPRPKPLTLSELHSIIPRLAATAKMLEDLARQYGGGRASSAAAPGAKVGRRARRSAGGSEKIHEKLLAALKGGKGLQLKDVVKRSGLDTGTVQYHLRALRSKKRVRVVGSRREARWHAA